MNIVFASHSAFHPSMVIGSHQLARVYAAGGHRVLHLSLPFSLLHLTRLRKPQMIGRFRTALSGPIKRQENLFEWVPLSLAPWDITKYALGVTDKNPSLPMSLRIRRALRKLDMANVDLALIDEPRMFGIEKVLRAKQTIYRVTDLYAQFRQDARILDAEAHILNSVDHVFATSLPVAEHLKNLQKQRCRNVKPVQVFFNGFDAQHFLGRTNPHRSLPMGSKTRVVYVGAVDHRFDISSVIGMAEQLPQTKVLIYGPQTIAIPDQLPSNLQMMGPLRYEELPSVLQHCQIALLPMTKIATNQGRSPMKYYEYRAAGAKIVSLAIDSLRHLGETDPSLFLYNEADSRDLTEAVTRAIESGPVEPMPEMLMSQSWDSISKRMLDCVDMLP